MCPHASFPEWPSSSLQTERNYGWAGTFVRPVFPVGSEGYPLFRGQGLGPRPRPVPRPETRPSNHDPQKRPGVAAGPWYCAEVSRWRAREGALRRLFLDHHVFVLALPLGGLGTAPRTLGKGG